ncbi:MAG: NFACT family protein [Armatimonadota bacterium]|nr:NFACT family protein [Armatimonadota bacterium]MDR7467410.1 NFACT family protein [Armatimonadota bacterium]MDR7494180.1 NFACT family protein [Armatimonadota bacterium]MDR7498854.1 NFACT family protein [Armatimonadota bacterium]MDR7504437.1 NFACT family protein [Armatimonadota bacterium]
MRPIGSFDSVVLAAVAADLATLIGSRLRRISQDDPHEVLLEFRAARALALLCSVHPQWARIHLALAPPGEARRGPFAQLLHSRLEGARLVSVRCPPFERVLTLGFQSDLGTPALVAEIRGPASNLILVEDGVVAGTLRAPARSAGRDLSAGSVYRPPTAGRPSPGELSEPVLRAILEAEEGPIAERLPALLFGISPTMAREVVARASLPATAPARDAAERAADLLRVLRELADLVARGAFEPVIYYAADTLRGYAPFPLVHVRGLRMERTATMSEAVARVTAAARASCEVDDLRARLEKTLREALADVDRAEGEVRRNLQEAAEGEEVRRRGELLLAYASQIAPGAAQVVVPGYDGAPVAIPLDPRLTAVENANALFARYTRMRRARPQLERRLQELDAERAYLESSLALVESAAAADDLRALRDELAEEGYVRRPRRRVAAATAPRAFPLPGGATVLVGRTNRENDRLTFEVARADDLWFHARGVPGAHVVLRTGGRPAREEEILQAAAIAAYFSRARSSGRVAVDCTLRRYVRKPAGGRPGVVTYERERTVRVVPGLP